MSISNQRNSISYSRLNNHSEHCRKLQLLISQRIKPYWKFVENYLTNDQYEISNISTSNSNHVCRKGYMSYLKLPMLCMPANRDKNGF